ncbi:MAG: hypothetical protein WDN28_33085 [Chthoniobacter sp.]
MDAVIAAAAHGAQFLYRVELVVAVGNAVQAAVLGIFVIVDAYPERVESPEQTVGGFDRCGETLDRCGVERLAGSRRREPVKSAVLVAGDDAALVVHTHGHPRALFLDRHGIEQLDLEILHHLDPIGRRGLVLIDALAGIGIAGLARARLGRGGRLGVGQAGEAQSGEGEKE